MRKSGFEHFNIQLVNECYTLNTKYFEQLEMNKYDDAILLNMIAADLSVKLSPQAKDKRNIIRLINKKLMIIICSVKISGI